VGVSPSPQINALAPGSSSDSQLIQNQSGDDKAKDPTVTMHVIQTHSTQFNVQDKASSVQNQHQKYPTMKNQDEKLAGWDLPRDYFETNV
jgi:hypothetical protein